MKKTLFFLIPVLLFFAGCRFDHPLTSGPSEDLNTWLLGEWESQDNNGASHIAVTPSAHDIYQISASIQAPGKVRQDYLFKAWASRVGAYTFLTLQSEKGSSDFPVGSHVFAHVQVVDQKTIGIRSLQLDSPSNATSMQLRKEVRDRLKDGSLYSGGKVSYWKRISDAYWQKDGKAGLFQPIRHVKILRKEKNSQLQELNP